MILITGATGLVGAHLIHHLLILNPNQKIKAIYRSETKKNYVRDWLLSKNTNINNLVWEQADILDIPVMESVFNNIDYVYHCAAIVNFDAKSSTNNLNKVNIEGTANMVNLSLQNQIKKFCYVSSIATLDEPNNNKVIDENCEWNPEKYHGDYAISKNGGETEVWRATAEGLDTIIVNPGIIFGDGFWESGSGDFFNKVDANFPFYTKGSTGFVAVDDVALCMIKLMNSEIKNERFILVENSYTFEEILKTIAHNLNKPKPKYYASPLLTGIFWRLDALITLITPKKRTLTKYTANSAHTTSNYSNNKITKAIDYNFTPILNYITQIAPLYIKNKKT